MTTPVDELVRLPERVKRAARACPLRRQLFSKAAIAARTRVDGLHIDNDLVLVAALGIDGEGRTLVEARLGPMCLEGSTQQDEAAACLTAR